MRQQIEGFDVLLVCVTLNQHENPMKYALVLGAVILGPIFFFQHSIQLLIGIGIGIGSRLTSRVPILSPVRAFQR